MSNIQPILVGSVITVTGANSIANNAYAVSADKLTIDVGSNAGLCVDFSLVPAWATAPTAGFITLVGVGWSLDGTPVAGPAPVATLNNDFIGNFKPAPFTSNAATTWTMTLKRVALGIGKTDFYLFNNGTGQTISSSWVLKAQVWTPGTV